MGEPESFLPDAVTADGESSFPDQVLAESDNVVPVSEAAQQSEEAPAAAAALLTEPKPACDEQKGRTDDICIFSASRSLPPEDLAQKAVRRHDRDECTEAGATPQHDLCLLEHRPKRAQQGDFANLKACTERLKVRVCVLAAPLACAPLA
jgi:hypothetical protein